MSEPEWTPEFIERCRAAMAGKRMKGLRPSAEMAEAVLRESGHADLLAALKVARRYVVIEWGRAERRSAEDLGAGERHEKEVLDQIDNAIAKASAS